MIERTDAELVATLQSSPADLDEFYRRHREAILRYAVRRCPQPADVADLVAETFLAAISAAPGFDPSRGSAEAWLIGIARNQWARRCEREARQRRLGERSLGDSLSPDDIGRLEERIDSVRRSAEVEGAIATLAEHHREALWLIGSDGLTVAEAAAATQGCEPMPTVPGQPTARNWQVVASEDQGPYTLLVYASGDTTATCLSALGTDLRHVTFGAGARLAGSATVATGPAAHGGSGPALAGIEPASIGGELATVLHGSSEQGSYTVVEGRVASGTTGRSLARAGGAAVVASVRDGWFAAWWPGSDDPTSADVTTAAGTTSTPVSPATSAGPASGAASSGGAAETTGAPAGGPSGSASTSGTSGSTVGNR